MLMAKVNAFLSLWTSTKASDKEIFDINYNIVF